MTGEPEFLKVEQLAGELQLHPDTIYAALARKDLRGAKFGTKWRIRREDADAWIESHMIETCQEHSGVVALSRGKAATTPLRQMARQVVGSRSAQVEDLRHEGAGG